MVKYDVRKKIIRKNAIFKEPMLNRNRISFLSPIYLIKNNTRYATRVEIDAAKSPILDISARFTSMLTIAAIDEVIPFLFVSL